MATMRLHAGAWLCFAMLGTATGCTGAEDIALGSLSVNLVGQSAAGAVYRLRDARIAVHGPVDHDWDSEDDPDQTSMSADVPTGSYSALLQDGWRLERLEGALASPVTAQLISDNPALFTVDAMQRTSVPLRFQVDGGDVDLTQGYDIVVTVEEPDAPVIAIANSGYFPFLPSIAVYPAHANGDVAPVRRLVGGSTGLSNPRSLTMLDDQLVAQNFLDFSAGLSFYPITASGDAPPARQLGGSLKSTVEQIVDVAISHDEIYVLQSPSFLSQSNIVVFPKTAQGDVAPVRALSFTFDRQRGDQPLALALDAGELYVAAGPPYRVDVYPASAAGAVTPTRTMTGVNGAGSCISGILIQGGEIFLSDYCKGQVRVFAATASGPVVPLRVIAGASTGLHGPTRMALFQGELYVCDYLTNSVRVFPAGADGNVSPTRVIEGPHTNLAWPWGIVVL